MSETQAQRGCRYWIINVTAIDIAATFSRLTVIKSNKLRTHQLDQKVGDIAQSSFYWLPFCGRFSIEFWERKSTSILNARTHEDASTIAKTEDEAVQACLP